MGWLIFWIVRAETLVVAVAAARAGLRACKVRRGVPRLARMVAALGCAILSLAFLAAFINAAFSFGRILTGAEIVPPGSWLSRIPIPFVNRVTRPAFEPWYIAIAAACGVLWILRQKRVWTFVFLNALCVALVELLLRSRVLGLSSLSAGGPTWESAPHFLVVQTFFFTIYCALRFGPEWERAGDLETRPISLSLLVAAATALAMTIATVSVHRPERLAGAHYYVWFPDNWSHGYAAAKLDPRSGPALGEYKTVDKSVFFRHVSWAEEAGIDFFILDWWPSRAPLRARVTTLSEYMKEVPKLRFALHYESLDTRFPRDTALPGETGNIVRMEGPRLDRMVKDFRFFAENYFKNPSYMRIGGRPVVFLYATRHLIGDVRGAMERVREAVREVSGEEIFLVGDEVYYDVPTYREDRGTALLPRYTPDWDRLVSFDAITAYNPLDTSKPEQVGGEDRTGKFLAETIELYRRYRAVAAAANVIFVPTVLPAYNDRVVRLSANHHVISPWIDTDGSSELFFARALHDWARPFSDLSIPLFSITSWNEWNEGTAIEPSVVSEPTTADTSPSTYDHTAGHVHQGLGCRYVSELRQFLQMPN